MTTGKRCVGGGGSGTLSVKGRGFGLDVESATVVTLDLWKVFGSLGSEAICWVPVSLDPLERNSLRNLNLRQSFKCKLVSFAVR